MLGVEQFDSEGLDIFPPSLDLMDLLKSIQVYRNPSDSCLHDNWFNSLHPRKIKLRSCSCSIGSEFSLGSW